MLDQLGCPASLRSFASIEDGSMMPPGTAIGQPTPVFPKLDPPAAVEPKAAAPAAPAVSVAGLSLEQLATQIVAVGQDIRELKGRKAGKDEIQPKVDALLALKQAYQALNNGVAYEPPK
jgi:hypothetical protein